MFGAIPIEQIVPNVSKMDATEALLKAAEYFQNNPNVWALDSVESFPEDQVTSWRVYELQVKGLEGKTRHLVSYSLLERCGKVSSPLQEVKLGPIDRLYFTTRSERVYTVLGRPGTNNDAEYTFRKWKRMNQATDETDVTSEYWDTETKQHKVP
jgi:hypothetical protein